MLSWFEILLIFLAVAATLAVGPFLLWRFILGSDANGKPPRRSISLKAISLTMGIVAFIAAFVIFQVRQSSTSVRNQPAQIDSGAVTTTAAHSGEVFDAERSLFQRDQVRDDLKETSVVHTVQTERPTALRVLVPVLAIILVFTTFAGRLRNTSLWFVPVACIVLIAGYRFVGTGREHVVIHEAGVQETATVVVENETAPRLDDPQEPLETLLEHNGQRRPEVTNTAVEIAANSEADESEPAVIDTETEAAATAVVVLPVTEYTGKELFGVPRDSLPEWTRVTPGDDESTIRVLHSGKHATVEAAEMTVLAQLKKLQRAEFVRTYPEAIDWVPADDVIIDSGSLLRRAVERSQIQVGEFVSPMYETYWQVDTSAMSPLYQAWRPKIVKTRLGWLGAGVGLLTLLFGSLAAVLRVDEQTGGRRRKSLAIGTVAMWVAIGSALLVVA